jgi:hypothetical protein
MECEVKARLDVELPDGNVVPVWFETVEEAVLVAALVPGRWVIRDADSGELVPWSRVEEFKRAGVR